MFMVLLVNVELLRLNIHVIVFKAIKCILTHYIKDPGLF